MNANDLNAKTVKALNVIARDLGMKRYSALRKADLIAAIVEFTAPEVKILDTQAPADAAQIMAIMAEVMPVAFSEAPVKAPQSVPAAPVVEDAQEDKASEILFAYRAMRTTFRSARGSLQVKLAQRLRTMGAQLKALGYDMRVV